MLIKYTKNKYFYILFFFIILIILNSKVIVNKGYQSRMPQIIQDVTDIEDSWLQLKNQKGEICSNKFEGCLFNDQFKKKIYILGDSSVGSLSLNLKEKLTEKKYKIQTYILGGCVFLPGYHSEDIKTKQVSKKCNDLYFDNVLNDINNNSNSIIILGGLYNIYFNGFISYKENGFLIKKKTPQMLVNKKENTNKNIINDFIKNIKVISKKNKVILMYPLPEIGFNVKNKLLQKIISKKIKKKIQLNDYITIDYNFFLNKQKKIFEAFDQLRNKNIYKVYPHKVFCNTVIKNKCITHNKKNIFYSDGFHLSYKGSIMINNLILDEIKKIENNL